VIRLSVDSFLQVVLAGAIATSNPRVYIAYTEWTGDRFQKRETTVALNGVTDVTLLTAPPRGVVFEIDSIVCCNTDTAAVTLHVKYDDTVVDTFLFKVTLAVGETFTWEANDAG